LETRDNVKKILEENGIPSMLYYPCGLHQQKAYEALHMPDEWYPNTIRASQTVLSLPMHPYLIEEEIDRITKVIVDNV